MVDRGNKPTFTANGQWWLLLAMLFWSTTASAQGKAFASIKPERAETGDTITLIVIVSGIPAKPKFVDFVAWADVFPPANILSKSEWKQSGTQWVQQFSLIAFDSAKLELPPLAVLLSTGKLLNTNPLSLTVFPTPGKDLSDMAPMRAIYREPVSWMDYWPWAAGALGLMALLYWYWRKTARKPKAVVVAAPAMAPLPPPISAKELALKKLTELQARQLWKKDQVKEHYAEISLIVREYLEGNYSIAALESTTAEIMPLLVSTHFPKNHSTLLRQILDQTDMVKYAQSAPPDTAHIAAVEKAKELIAPNLPPTPTKPFLEDNKPPL